MNMRIFVGTLYTIENEIDECCRSIYNQTYSNYEHFIFEGLPNKEAHDHLYKTFMEKSDEFDLMIKVDADMVIIDRKLFAKIISKFKSDIYLDELNIAVYDFLADQLIWGMHTYRNTVIWKENDENLFVDKTPDTIRKQILDNKDLAPAAIHNKNPTSYQAFHFGFHRSIKSVQPGRVFAVRNTFQWKILKGIKRHLDKKIDKRFAFALLGAEIALKGEFQDIHVSHGNPKLKNFFDIEISSLNLIEIQNKIKSLKLRRLGILPYPFDYMIIFLIFRIRAILAIIFNLSLSFGKDG